MHDTVHVAGPGALGLFVATNFSRAGRRTRMISRPGTPTTSVTPTFVTGAPPQPFPAREALPLLPATALPAGAWRNATVVITVKARDLTTLLAQLSTSFIETGSTPATVLVLSNGLGITETLRQWKAKLRTPAVARGTAWFGCLRESTERVRFAGPARLDWAWLDDGAEHPPLDSLLREALSPCGIEVIRENSAEKLEWRKGAWNASMNALLALADAPNGVLLDEGSPLRRRFNQLLEESFRVAAAEGTELGAEDRDLIWDSIRRTRTNWNSMHGDLRSGRPTELPHLNGWLVEKARHRGVPIPAHEELLAQFAAFVPGLAGEDSALS